MNQRRCGIDILRLLSMFMVVLLHNLGQGGGLAWTFDTAHEWVLWYIENFSIVAVDVFALISGFLLVGKKDCWKNVASLYLTVWFWSAVLNLPLVVLQPEGVAFDQIVRAVFPVLSKGYWYFNAYLLLLIFAPFLNAGISRFSSRGLLGAAFMMLALMCSVGFLGGLGASSGYSTIWLACLYVCGAAVRLNEEPIFNAFSRRRMLAAVLLLPAASLLLQVDSAAHGANAGRWISYVSPVVAAQALALFGLILRVDVEPPRLRKILKVASASAFSVYLIDMSALVFSFLLKDAFSFTRAMPTVQAAAVIVGASILMFVGFLLMDIVRLRLLALIRRSSSRAQGI